MLSIAPAVFRSQVPQIRHRECFTFQRLRLRAARRVGRQFERGNDLRERDVVRRRTSSSVIQPLISSTFAPVGGTFSPDAVSLPDTDQTPAAFAPPITPKNSARTKNPKMNGLTLIASALFPFYFVLATRLLAEHGQAKLQFQRALTRALADALQAARCSRHV